MKRKLSLLVLLCALVSVAATLSACSISASGSIKSITKPYIAQYECIEARLGTQNLLEKYEYIIITFLDSEEMEISFKPNDGEKKSFKGNYSVDPETREFSGEMGIFGYTFRERTK
ncbi:MAG: hypothetical protein K2N30_00910, partial [Clostridia bacterium]|nr:hypothetical protein [Clostridia bacterium]